MECSCENIREIIREEIQKVMGKGAPTGRVKRRPSGYNLYIADCTKGGKDMKGCAVDYKALSQDEKDTLKARAAAGAPPDAPEKMLKSVI